MEIRRAGFQWLLSFRKGSLIAYLGVLKLYDTSPASLYQGEALAHFRELPLRHVNGVTVSVYYGGSELLGLASCRVSRVCASGTLSVGRCHVLCCYTPSSLLAVHWRKRSACNYISCIFQCRRLRYATTGVAYHHQELRFVVHSPYTQDLQSKGLHIFNPSPRY